MGHCPGRERPAARPDQRPRQVHLHRPELSRSRRGDGKWAPSIVDPGEPILRPRGSKQLDWEVELGVVIGRTARYVSKEQALDHVYGYTIVNDASARDFQFLTTQWMAGKIFDTAAPVGPYIADRQEIPDPHSLELKTFVNGKQMQRGNTKTFIFDVRYLVSYLSGLMTLSASVSA